MTQELDFLQVTRESVDVVRGARGIGRKEEGKVVAEACNMKVIQVYSQWGLRWVRMRLGWGVEVSTKPNSLLLSRALARVLSSIVYW